jgi:hypothetical protein
MQLACLLGFDILGPALKLACCYLDAANAAAEVVQVVPPQTSIFIPSITLSLLGSLSFRRTNHLNKILKMLKFSISEAKIWPSKGPKASNSPLVDFCRETPRGPNPWFHVFPPRPNSRGFTSKDVIRLQKRSTDAGAPPHASAFKKCTSLF